MTRQERIRLIRLKRVKYKRKLESSYYEFFKEAWKDQEPETELSDNWHIKYLCDVAQAEIERIALNRPKDKDVIINISPRSSKSKIFSINLVPWAWSKYPWLKFINSSHTAELSTEYSVKSRRLIEGDWYQGLWGHHFRMTSDQNVKNYYVNNKGGERRAVSVGSKVSGKGADVIVDDDPIDPEDCESDVSRKRANSHNRSLYSRLNNKKVGVRFLIMQRVHGEDTTGEELKKRKDKYLLICLPAEEKDWINPPELRVFYKNGLFDTTRFDNDILEEARRFLGTRKYEAQFLQKPPSDGGAIYKRSWFKNFYSVLPEPMDYFFQSWDFAFKDTKESSYVVGQVWGYRKGMLFLVYQFRQQCDFNASIKAITQTSILYPKATKKYIEDKANGPAIIAVVKSKIAGIEPVTVSDSKEARYHASSPFVEDGNVWLPDPSTNPWILDFFEEVCSVTGKTGEVNDQADAMAQAILKTNTKNMGDLKTFLSCFK